MNDKQAGEIGTAILRIALGIVLLMHSVYLKWAVFTLPGTASFFESLALPGWSAYVVFAIEATAGVGLVLGIGTRVLSLAVLPILIGATWAHFSAGWLFSNNGGGWEYPLFLTTAALAQALLGTGAWSAATVLAPPAARPVAE